MTNPETDLPAQTSATGSPARGLSYLYIAAAFVIVVAGMRAASAVLNPLLLAVFLSIVCAPIYLTLLKRGISNWLALLIVIGALSFIMVSVVFVVMESVAGFTSRQAHYQRLLDRKTDSLQAQINEWLPDWALPQKEEKESQDESSDDPNVNESEQGGGTLDQDTVATDEPSGSDDGEGQPTAEPKAPKPEHAGSRKEEASGSRQLDGSGESESVPADSNAEDKPANEETESIEPAPATSADTDAQTDAANQTSSLVHEPERHRSVSPGSETIRFGDDDTLPKTAQSWRDYISEQFNPGTALSMAARVAGSIGQLLSNAFLILLTVVFVLLEMSTFADKMKVAFAGASDAEGRGQQIIKSIHNYVVIKTSVSLATGFLVAIWLNILGVPYSGLWGLVAFLFNFIPNVGSIIAAIPAVLVAWLELTLFKTVLCAMGFLVINASIGNLIEPRLMGRGLGLSPLVVFCSMVFWGWVLGPIGMVLSVPLTMTARIALEGFEDTKWIGILMGPGEASGPETGT